MNKEFYLSNHYQIHLFDTKKKKILLFKFLNKLVQIFELPSFIIVKKIGNKLSLLIKSPIFSEKLISFSRAIFTMLKSSKKMYKKTLMLKGLGLKISFLENILRLKLGFSHLISIKIPFNVLIFIKKNVITFESYDLSLIGNVATKIRGLKFPNSYKQKGFWYKNERRTLKHIKKT